MSTTALDGQQLAEYCTRRLITSTRDLRTVPAMRCPRHGLQRCHLVGLNLIKTVFNALGYGCRMQSADALVTQLRAEAGAVDNYDCCTERQNLVDDVSTEREVLAALLGGGTLETRTGVEMTMRFAAMMTRVQRALSNGRGTTPSESIDDVLKLVDAALRRSPAAAAHGGGAPLPTPTPV